MLTALAQIASVISGTYGEQMLYVVVHIDEKAISALQVRSLVPLRASPLLTTSQFQLEVTIGTIRESIINAPKLKIKASVRRFAIFARWAASLTFIVCRTLPRVRGPTRSSSTHARTMRTRRPTVAFSGFAESCRALLSR